MICLKYVIYAVDVILENQWKICNRNLMIQGLDDLSNFSRWIPGIIAGTVQLLVYLVTGRSTK